MLQNILNFVVGLSILRSIGDANRISQIKCEEYINGTITRASVISLIPDPIPIEYYSFNCSRTVDLIVGGDEARKGEFRHHALLGWETDRPGVYTFDCGGTLISERYVLTAAHCTSVGTGPRAAPKIVRFGETDLTAHGDEFDVKISSIARHPRYQFGKSYNDIALIRLKSSVSFSSDVRPACLWDNAAKMNFSSVIATGFGRVDFDSTKNSDTLRKVRLDILDPTVCNEHFKGTRNFKRGMTNNLLCIGSKRGGQDTCQGDSGGPVQVLLNPKGCTYHVVGITSAGLACGLGTTNALYTKVASYIDWIESVVWG